MVGPVMVYVGKQNAYTAKGHSSISLQWSEVDRIACSGCYFVLLLMSRCSCLFLALLQKTQDLWLKQTWYKMIWPAGTDLHRQKKKKSFSKYSCYMQTGRYDLRLGLTSWCFEQWLRTGKVSHFRRISGDLVVWQEPKPFWANLDIFLN